MSGILGTLYSALNQSGGAADLFATIYGNGAAGGIASGQDPLTALKLAQKNQAREIAAEKKDPEISRDIRSFAKAVALAKDIRTALVNPNVLKVLLTANGLDKLQDQPALVQKALLSDPGDPKSLINRLGNTALKSLATTFRFDKNGLGALRDPKVQATLTDGYAEVRWRQSLDQTTPGLSYALNFRDKAAGFKTVDAILGDRTGWEVVLTALNIPQEIAFQELPAQERQLSARLDITKLQDKHFVDSLTQQYLLNKQTATQGTTTTPTLSALAVQARGLVV